VTRRAPGLAALVLGGGLLAACSSGSSTATTVRTTRPDAGSTTTSRAATSTTASGSSTVPSGPSLCPTTGLSGSVAGSSGAAGTVEVTVGLKSISATTCVLTGYPGLQLLGPGGSPLPTNVQRKGTYPFTAMAPTTVTLASGQSAYFNIGYSDVPVGAETTCPTSTSLEVTPPDATNHLLVVASLTPCGGGTMVVSPVFAAGSAGSQSTAPPSG
jgi:Protein of unknown function (DUF4232)